MRPRLRARVAALEAALTDMNADLRSAHTAAADARAEVERARTEARTDVERARAAAAATADSVAEAARQQVADVRAVVDEHGETLGTHQAALDQLTAAGSAADGKPAAPVSPIRGARKSS